MTCREKGCPWPVEREGDLCKRHARMFEKEQWMLARVRRRHERERPVSIPLEIRACVAKRKSSPYTARIIELICTEGLSNFEIAERLFLTEGTVKVYVSEALLSVGAKSRSKMIVAYWKAQLTAKAS